MKKQIILASFIFLNLNSYSQNDYPINWDTIQFEEPYQYLIIDTSSQNIWQIGRPQKSFFDSAYSKFNAIVTDTIGFYPVNNYSYFDLYIGAFNYFYEYPYDIYVEFKHKFDTDPLKDGGYLTVSYDKGNTWTNIIDDSTYYYGSPPRSENENLYSDADTLFNGEKGFSGRSSGWITTRFSWHAVLVKSAVTEIGDTMILRFNFISDNINTNKEGWMIDDIRLHSEYLGSAVKDIKASSLMKIYPNPSTGQFQVDVNSQKNMTFEICDLTGKILYSKDFSSTIQIDLKGLTAGLYLATLKCQEKILETKKIIIK